MSVNTIGRAAASTTTRTKLAVGLGVWVRCGVECRQLCHSLLGWDSYWISIRKDHSLRESDVLLTAKAYRPRNQDISLGKHGQAATNDMVHYPLKHAHIVLGDYKGFRSVKR